MVRYTVDGYVRGASEALLMPGVHRCVYVCVFGVWVRGCLDLMLMACAPCIVSIAEALCTCKRMSLRARMCVFMSDLHMCMLYS